MIDAVLSYHTNPYTCGVAKWNLRLANELGVPLLKLKSPEGRLAQYPLISVKPSEIPPRARVTMTPPYDLILHDWPSSATPARRFLRWVMEANHVWAVNLAAAGWTLTTLRPDVYALPCPSTIQTPRPRAAHTYLTFGMANKTQRVLPHYERFRDRLIGQDYTILLSLGVHEGSPWDDALESSANALRDIFGADRVEVLGFLSDAALHREIEAATACVAFYDPAIRANNTTAWAVLERGKPLFTNCDDLSPQEFGIAAVPRWDMVIGLLVPAGDGSMTPAPYPETRSECPADGTDPPGMVATGPPSLCP